MRAVQAVIAAGPAGGQPLGQPQGYALDDRVNADETASRFAASPLNQYVPADARRGAAPALDERARFTTMLGGTAAGSMLPCVHVVKCAVDRADLRSTTVLAALHGRAGFTEADGWALRVWERELALRSARAAGGAEAPRRRFFRPYLAHADGTVITVQLKAWMDSVGVCKWADLVIGPWARASGRAKLLV
jgi:hypothetical protein